VGCPPPGAGVNVSASGNAAQGHALGAFSSPVAVELLQHAIRSASEQGAERLITVSPVGVERLLRRAGFKAQHDTGLISRELKHAQGQQRLQLCGNFHEGHSASQRCTCEKQRVKRH
jgi:hypothetical protein